jgi:hypothetical protein
MNEEVQDRVAITQQGVTSPRLDQILGSFKDSTTVKFGATGESLIERLFRRAFILIMEHNGVAEFDNKPVEYEDTIFTYYSAEVVDDPKIVYLSGADFIKLTGEDEYAVIARLKFSEGAPATYYVSTTSESFVTMAIMKFT